MAPTFFRDIFPAVQSKLQLRQHHSHRRGFGITACGLDPSSRMRRRASQLLRNVCEGPCGRDNWPCSTAPRVGELDIIHSWLRLEEVLNPPGTRKRRDKRRYLLQQERSIYAMDVHMLVVSSSHELTANVKRGERALRATANMAVTIWITC